MSPAILAFGIVVLVLLIVVRRRNRQDRRGADGADTRRDPAAFGDAEGDGDGGD